MKFQPGWGKLTGKDFSLSPSVTHSVVEKEFSPDYNREFYRLARLYTNENKDFNADQGQIDQFPTPEITQYKLECWGAASWGTTYGGGYSYGYYEAKEKIRFFMSAQEQKVLVEVRTPILPGIWEVKVDIMGAEMVVMVVLV